MRPYDGYMAMVETEIKEADFKFHRLQRFLGLVSGELETASVEKSVIQFSSRQEPMFRKFNIARIQETSPEGIGEVDKVMSTYSLDHIVATAPIGISEAEYKKLVELGYKPFSHRSCLYLKISDNFNRSHNPQVFFEIGNSSQNLKLAHMVLNSFQPTSEEEFRRSYTYWLDGNEKARLVIANANEQAIGMGILSWDGSTGILSSGVVAPSHRGRGLQKSLIQQRISIARELQLQYLFAPGVPPLSASETSLRDCGFSLICNRMFWKKNRCIENT